MTKMYIDLQAEYPLLLPYLNESWIFSTDFSKNTQKSNFMKIRLVEVELFQEDGQTD
jgi:hypothetical protein